MSRRHTLRKAVAALVGPALVVCAATGCTSERARNSSSTSSSTARPSVTASPVPRPPTPKPGRCFRLTYRAALAATSDRSPVACRVRHTAATFFVGRLDLVVSGHLLSPDSARARAQVAQVCPQRLGPFLGTTPEQLRLTSVRAVWFVPTVEESGLGADWFRCDVVAVAGPQRLAPLAPGNGRGLLSSEQARLDYGICGTAEPGSAGFHRVICSVRHTWRAITSYDVDQARYPGTKALRAAAADTCQTAAQQVAADSLSYQWGYDWPTAEQWRHGQHYGLCWAPEPAAD